MKDLTLIIPTKEESESLPIFLKELDLIPSLFAYPYGETDEKIIT